MILPKWVSLEEIKMRKQSYTISRFVCQQCGNEGIPIPRKMRKQREKGHIKHLYCIYCKKRTPHKEIRNSDFKESEEDNCKV